MHSILMIDDQPEQLASHTQFLKEKGCSVTVASSVQAAFDKLHQSSYDLILLDVKMPKVSGLDCCRALRNVSSAPVLFLSNYSEDNDQVRGFSAGGYDYISKECSLELFWARLRRCFQPKDQANTLRYYPPMTLDLERQKVTLGQKTVLLTLFLIQISNQRMARKHHLPELLLPLTHSPVLHLPLHLLLLRLLQQFLQ